MQQVEQESQFWQGAPVAPALDRASVTATSTKKPRARRPFRGRIKGARLRAYSIAAAALTGALVYTVATEGGQHTRASNPLLPSIENAAAALGLGLDQIAITGQKYTPDSDIFAALDLQSARSFATLDADAAKARIEDLPWIEKAEIVRAYPGRLDIRVTERTPWAVWHRASGDSLIDQTGRVLASVKNGSGAGLLRLAGEGAAKEAPALMAVLARYPDVARQLSEAERIAERRWTLKLKHGITLILPPERESQALSTYVSDRSVQALTAGGGFAVDLRGTNKITLRKLTGPSPADPEAKS